MRGKGIPELKNYQGRNPHGYFEDLPWDVKRRAYQRLYLFCERAKRKRGHVPQWLFGIYVGQAKRLALNPPTSEWGRSMLAKKGGYAVQEKYRDEGRHPTKIATHVRVLKQKRKKCLEEGLPLVRFRHLPLD